MILISEALAAQIEEYLVRLLDENKVNPPPNKHAEDILKALEKAKRGYPGEMLCKDT